MHGIFDTEAVRLSLDPRRVISKKEQWSRFWDSHIWEYLIVEAKRVGEEHAASWRDFKVGCAVYAWDSKRHHKGDFAGRWKIFRGCNMKPVQGGHNVCAEQVAIGAARSEGYEWILGMALVGIPQEDGCTGIKGKTLHPCGDCRSFFASLPEITPDTVIITATPDEAEVETQTVKELLKFYALPKKT